MFGRLNGGGADKKRDADRAGSADGEGDGQNPRPNAGLNGAGSLSTVKRRSPSLDEYPEPSLPIHGKDTSNERDTASFGRVLSYFNPGTAVKGSSDQHGLIMRLRRFFGAIHGRVEGSVGSTKARWLYGLACGRRRTDWFAALVFLVPCSICFTLFMWPYVLPSDLIENVYRSTATSARSCTAMTETYVAPIVAQQYEVNRAKCLDQGGCPSAEQMGSLICQQTSACGADPVEAAKNLNNLVNLAAGGGGGFAGKRRRSLLQFEGLVDLVGEGGGGAFPEDAVEVDDALAEAASPCTGCKKLATQVFKEAENGAPDKRWVEAMIRVHGREWCVRQSASVLPEYDPWQTYRGITSWAQVGNTPADANYMKANGIPKFGGANAMKSKNTDANTQWPPQDALRNASGYNPFVSNATGNRNGTFDNSTFVDPPVNEALMEILLENSPQLACPMRKADKQAKFKALQNGETWPPPAGPPPSWAKHCVKNATVATYGFVGDVSVNSRTSLEFAILLPAFVMFSIMLINSASELYFVETPITFAGIVVLGLVLADNWRAVHNMVHCMDRVFLVLNIVHMSILAGAMLAAVGLLGHRSLIGGTAWSAEKKKWAEWMAHKMLKGPKNAQFNVKRANIIVQGSANMLANSAMEKLMPGLNVAAGAGKTAGSMVLSGVKKGARFAKPSQKLIGKSGFPKVISTPVENFFKTKVMGKPPKPAHKRLMSLKDDAQLEFAQSPNAVASEVNTQKLGNLGKVNKREVDVLMATWREGVNRIIQARSSAKLIEVKDDGGLGWQQSVIPQHKIGFSGRLRMGIFGTLFVAIVCSLIASQQVRRFIEVLRWSGDARWCSWAYIGIRDDAFEIIDKIATAICVFLPIGTFAVIVGQLIGISETYRSNISALRRGEPVFTRKQMEASEISVGSEWLGYQLVTAGMTYFIVIIVFGVGCFGLAIPIIALLNVDPALQSEVITTLTYIGVVWVSGIMVGVIYRMAHVKLFTEPRLNVLRYVHWFQFSDYIMLYITMQRSFIVVVTRILMSVVVQAACIMRSDMTFFPLMIGKTIDKPHMAYISVVLNDWKYSCPIVWSFYSTALEAGRQNSKLRKEVEQKLRLKYAKEAPSSAGYSKVASRKSGIEVLNAGISGVAKGVTGVKNFTTGAFSELFFGGNDGMSAEMREEFEMELQKVRRSRRARTRWFLALTLTNNPSLIAMRRPWGGKPSNLARLKPSHLPHAIKKGWLRRRGGILGVVNDDYVMLTPGVLYIFEHDLASNPKVYPLSSRVLVRKLFVSVRDQTAGGWHFNGDRYEPGPDEVDPPDAEDGLRSPPKKNSDKKDKKKDDKKKDDKKKDDKKRDDKDSGNNEDHTQTGMVLAESAESNKKWKLKDKYFFVVTIPGGPMEVFASTDQDEVSDWVSILRESCLGAPDPRRLAGVKRD